MKIDRLVVRWDREYKCYDVEVFDERATVGDFELACDQVLAGPEVKKIWSDSCIGCSICCTGRIPLTSIDVIRLIGGGKRDLSGWVEKYARISRHGECIDITMDVDQSALCRHWNQENGRCLVYPRRPLACRTYLCAPMSHRMKEMRSEIINQGEDELVRLVIKDRSRVYDRKNALADQNSYDHILLKDICSKRLWRYLCRHD